MDNYLFGINWLIYCLNFGDLQIFSVVALQKIAINDVFRPGECG